MYLSSLFSSNIFFKPLEYALLVIAQVVALAEAVTFARVDDQFSWYIVFAESAIKLVCLIHRDAGVTFAVDD